MESQRSLVDVISPAAFIASIPTPPCFFCHLSGDGNILSPAPDPSLNNAFPPRILGSSLQINNEANQISVTNDLGFDQCPDEASSKMFEGSNTNKILEHESTMCNQLQLYDGSTELVKGLHPNNPNNQILEEIEQTQNKRMTSVHSISFSELLGTQPSKKE
ncbi:unnamed protein product [Protopolystoma xenopodis]|uniref:Uncharacterized protein n=1 Tax=Protopolystoma xenopodis TaxID=117903 RepID=A0A3S5BTB7_9PLAT|nr:unnamed protein product [Protopolystoma xenopodis]